MYGIATMLCGSVPAGALRHVFGIVFEFGNVFERSVFVLRARNLSPLRAGNAFEFGNAAELVVRVRERGRAGGCVPGYRKEHSFLNKI